MKVSSEPVQRITYPLVEKSRIVQEAYSTTKNIRPTARKYNVQPHQIREWKTLKIDVEYDQLNTINIVRQNAGTAAQRAVAIAIDSDDESIASDTSMQKQQVEQEERKERKRKMVAHRKEGGGRKCKFSRLTIDTLKGFFDDSRERDTAVDIHVMIAQARLIAEEECSLATTIGVQHRIYRMLKKWNVSWRRGTHQSQNTRYSTKVIRDFHKYIGTKIRCLGIKASAVYNFDETNIDFCPNLNSTYCIKGKITIGIKVAKSSQRCTVMLGCSMTGEKVPPFVIFAGADTKNGVIRKQIANKTGLPQSMEYQVQKKAWMDEASMLEWIERVWKPTAQ
jgi:Ni/Co efflux regulator RcnB